MKLSNPIFSALSLASLTFASVATAQTSTYYFFGNDSVAIDNLSAWRVENNSGSAVPTAKIDANTALVFDNKNKGKDMVRINPPSASGIPFSAHSMTVGDGKSLEMWVTSSTYITTDISINTGVDSYDPTYANLTTTQRQFRIAMDNVSDIINVGGNINLSTTKYFTTKLAPMTSAIDFNINVGGAINFYYNSDFTSAGNHTLEFNDASQKAANMNFNIGGLNSTTKGVFVTTIKSSHANFNFKDDANGQFTGGNFTGILATESNINGSVSFSMNSATSKEQSIKIYKAANGAECGLGEFSTKKDMEITALDVSKGIMNFDTETNITEVSLTDGTLNLTMSSDAKVGTLNLAGGNWVFSGLVNTDNLNVTDSINIVFTDELEQDVALDIIYFEKKTLATDLSFFNALDKDGSNIAGTFAFDNNKLTFTAAVPEPSTIAGIAGLLALAFAAYRRRK